MKKKFLKIVSSLKRSVLEFISNCCQWIYYSINGEPIEMVTFISKEFKFEKLEVSYDMTVDIMKARDSAIETTMLNNKLRRMDAELIQRVIPYIITTQNATPFRGVHFTDGVIVKKILYVAVDRK